MSDGSFDSPDQYYNTRQLARKCEAEGYSHAIVDYFDPAEVRRWNVPFEVKHHWLEARKHLRALFEAFDLARDWPKPGDGRALFKEKYGEG